MKNNGKLGISFVIAYTDEIDLIQMANGKTSKHYTFKRIKELQKVTNDFLNEANEENTNEHILKFYRRLKWKYDALIHILERM